MEQNNWLEDATIEKIKVQVKSVLEQGVDAAFKKRAKELDLDPESAFETVSKYSASQWTSSFVDFWSALSSDVLVEKEMEVKTQQYMREAGLFGILDLTI